MALPPFGFNLSPIALTRTVQSILSPFLYAGAQIGSSSSVASCSPACDTETVKIEEDGTIKTEGDEKPATVSIDLYAETVDTVVRSNVLDGKHRKICKKRTAPKKEQLKAKKRRLCANPELLEAPLKVNEQLSPYQSNGKDQMWWFVLKVLMDPANRPVVAWTGQYYSFRVIDKERFTRMWCLHNGRNRIIAWSSVCRAMRLCYGDKGILTPVSQRHRVWAFVVDISIPLKMSREAIQDHIDQYKEVPPNAIIFNDHRAYTQVVPLDGPQVLELDMGERPSNVLSMEASSSYTPTTDPSLSELESMSLPTPDTFSPLTDFSYRAPLSSHSTLSPLSSPYWLPVPFSPMFSSYFTF